MFNYLLDFINILYFKILLIKLERALIKHSVYILFLALMLLFIIEVLKQVNEILKRLNFNIIKVFYFKPFLFILKRIKYKDLIKCIIIKYNFICNSIFNIFKVDKIFNTKKKVFLKYLIKELYYKTKYLIAKILVYII